MGVKTCCRCREEKPFEEYYKSKATPDGFHPQCKDCKKSSDKRAYEKKKEEKCARQRAWYAKNYESQREKAKNRYFLRMSVDSERAIINRNKRDWERARSASDPSFRINKSFSRQIAVQINKENRSWKSAVGFSLDDLMNHLERQFTTKMTWDNYGTYWHIDHIVPKSLFNVRKIGDDEFMSCWCLSNLRPLEAIENLKKSKKRSYLI